MVTDDKHKKNATGFSGLSTLVSDVETSSSSGDIVPNIAISRNDVHDQNLSSGSANEAPKSAVSAPQPTVETSAASSEVTTGKWLVGLGLGIGFLLIVLVNLTKNESTRPVVAPVAQSPTTAALNPSPASANQVPPGRQPAQETLSRRSTATISLEVIGQQVAFSNPRGYCTPGKTEREVELMDLARRSTGEGSRLVHAAVLCSELDDYKSGQREMLDHWLQILLIGPKGKFQRVEMAREAFLSGISKSIPRVDPVEINRRLKASFDNSDISLSQMKFDPIGRDGNAVYYSIQMNMSIGDTSRPITGISGITLLNSLPLSINVYEGTGSPQSRSQLQSVQQELLNSLLTEN